MMDRAGKTTLKKKNNNNMQTANQFATNAS